VKPTSLFLITSLLIAGLYACTVTSNVGDLARSDAESGVPGADGDLPEGSLADTAQPDADGAPSSIDAGCGVTFPQEATLVDVQVRDGVSPQPTGGQVVAGTYVLTAMEVYFAGTTGTARVRETMEVRGGSPGGTIYRLIEAEQASGSFKNIPRHGETSLYDADVTSTMFITPQCPQKRFQSGNEYSVKPDKLVIYESSNGIERTYQRLR